MIKLLTMLVHHDQTVKNAHQVYSDNKHAPSYGWGCKDIGLSLKETIALLDVMKSDNKKTYLEMMGETEEQNYESALLAVGSQLDGVIGGTYSKKVEDLLSESFIQYYPFVGELVGTPRQLKGSIDEIVGEAIKICRQNVTGITIAIYRYKGDVDVLLSRLSKEIKKPIIVAGSVDSHEKIKQLQKADIFAITVGSAFFERKFDPESFYSNIEQLHRWLKE